jgi:hypothetical protein
MSEGDSAPLWRVRDTLVVVGLLAWGAAWIAFAVMQLADGPLAERRSLLDLFCLPVGLAGLYVSVGVAVLRAREVIAAHSRH